MKKGEQTPINSIKGADNVFYEIKQKTIPAVIDEAAEKFPDTKALMFNRGDGKLFYLTYSAMKDRIVRLSSWMQRKNWPRGSHIAILGQNSVEWATTYLAIQYAGLTAVPIDAGLRLQEIRHILRHSEAKALFISRKHAGTLLSSNELQIDIPNTILEDTPELAEKEQQPLPPRPVKDPDKPASIIYTSGTTGSPKGVVLTHRNIVSDIADVLQIVEILHEDVFLSVLPIHHSFEGTAGFLLPLATGSGICYARALRSKEILEDIEAANVTIMLGVPLLFEKFYSGIKKGVEKKGRIAQTIFGGTMALSNTISRLFNVNASKAAMKPFREKAGFGRMRLMISGGAAIRPEVVEFFNQFGITCIQGYGLSETSPVICVNRLEDNNPRSVGPALPSVKIRIDGEDVGEIQAKGPVVFSEYFKNPKATKEAFTKDGWFKTGDLGRIDEHGHVYIVGRAKNIIVTDGGKNVQPEEIEDKINNSPLVSECLIVGKKTGRGGEEPYAVIVPDFDALDARFGSGLDEEEMRKHFKKIIDEVNNIIAPYKRIKGFKIQYEEFPKTSTRKIKRYLFKID